MQIGDAVRITAGPLAGLHGLLKAVGPRVLITIDLPSRRLDVEMELHWVAAAELERRPAMGIKEPAGQVRGKGA